MALTWRCTPLAKYPLLLTEFYSVATRGQSLSGIVCLCANHRQLIARGAVINGFVPPERWSRWIGFAQPATRWLWWTILACTCLRSQIACNAPCTYEHYSPLPTYARNMWVVRTYNHRARGWDDGWVRLAGSNEYGICGSLDVGHQVILIIKTLQWPINLNGCRWLAQTPRLE